jgi:pyruvate,orthophosphate dikinase
LLNIVRKYIIKRYEGRKYMSKKYVYLFQEGNGTMRNLLGGKGAGLAEMTNLGLPVPTGFTITTEACTRYYDDNETLHPDIQKEIFDTLEKFEKSVGKKLGDPNNPLLVSVRSGARVSMPGMMDTVLNLGINDDIVQALIRLTGNETMTIDYVDIKIQDNFLAIRDKDLNQILINQDFIREVRYYDSGNTRGSSEDDKG